MRTHFLITLIALIITACASHNSATATNPENQKTTDQFSYRDGQGSNYR